MKSVMKQLPAVVRKEIAAQAVEPPSVLLSEDRDRFLAGVSRQFQTEAEAEWNHLVDDTDRKREEWLTRVVAILTPLLDGTRSPVTFADIQRNNIRSPQHDMLTSEEAAAYLRKSESWLLRVPDMPYLPGKPNLYVRSDLDAWVEKHKVRPKVRV